VGRALIEEMGTRIEVMILVGALESIPYSRLIESAPPVVLMDGKEQKESLQRGTIVLDGGYRPRLPEMGEEQVVDLFQSHLVISMCIMHVERMLIKQDHDPRFFQVLLQKCNILLGISDKKLFLCSNFFPI
jgi:hypothetical protein